MRIANRKRDLRKAIKWYREGYLISEIAHYLQYDPSTICLWLKKSNIPKRPIHSTILDDIKCLQNDYDWITARIWFDRQITQCKTYKIARKAMSRFQKQNQNILETKLIGLARGMRYALP